MIKTDGKTFSVKPLLKWAGGKRQLLPAIEKYLPSGYPSEGSRYFEPFLGGGALLFHLCPEKAVVSDINSQLINFYTVLRDDCSGLIRELRKLPVDSDSFYRIRFWDREEGWVDIPASVKAARLLYLNKTCYNGLFRVNRRGEFNAPYGKYRNPRIINEERLSSASRYLQSNDIILKYQDFEKTMEGAGCGDLVYLDPPYDPVTSTASFTGYTRGGFDRSEQVRLKEACDRLDSRGVLFLLSNSATEFILDLYRAYNINITPAKRNINSVGNSRGRINEVLIRNYSP